MITGYLTKLRLRLVSDELLRGPVLVRMPAWRPSGLPAFWLSVRQLYVASLLPVQGDHPRYRAED